MQNKYWKPAPKKLKKEYVSDLNKSIKIAKNVKTPTLDELRELFSKY